MNILIIGSGGREHALAWKIKQSKYCDRLYIAPGNAGTAQCGQNVSISLSDHAGLKSFCIENDIDMLLVGPEVPLVEGITDSFRQDDLTKNIKIIGPSAHAAQLEGSKAFAKKFMQKYDIPTAGYIEVNNQNLQDGFHFMENQQGPFVLKADGLAAGKGVLIIDDLAEAKASLTEMLDGKFGLASEIVVIETFLSGIEFSVFALTDGHDFILLPEAKDYKRIGEGDTGLNTGGMGAISPVPFVDANIWEKVKDTIVIPTIKGIQQEKMDYVGFVFFGLIVVNEEPFVIEYNCRLGDPETEAIIPRIASDLVELLSATAEGRLAQTSIEITPDSASTVMMVSGGYPGDFEKNKVISGIYNVEGSLVFHAGTTFDEANELVTNGGRVIAVTSLDSDFRNGVKKSLENARKIHYDGKHYRSDIGFDL